MAKIPQQNNRLTVTVNPTAQFADVIREAGYSPPDNIEPGKFHRYPGEGKRSNNDAGWCMFFLDGLGGIYGDYSTGQSSSWQARRETPYSLVECEAFKRQVVEAKAQAEEARATAQAAASARASKIWNSAKDAPADHPYLSSKKINANGARLFGNALVIPVQDASGIQSLQFIRTDGSKTFMPRGRIAGCYYTIGSMAGAKTVCICEGFATGASIHEATDLPVVVAFNAGNLMSVVKAMHKQFQDVSLLVCADDDWRTAGNPGITKATEAAQSVGALVAFPQFGTDRPEKATDFNDMAIRDGLEAVRNVIASASNAAASDTYPEPLPLPKLPPVPDFPIDLLPDALKEFVADCAIRARYRPDFAAVASMVALGSVIGRKVGIRLKQYDDWTEYANVWGGTVGPPSALKSPANRDGVRPFKALQVAADEIYHKAFAEYLDQLAVFNLRKDAKKKAAAKALAKDEDAEIDLGDDVAPEAPIHPTYWTSDATAAKLGELLAANPNGLLVERDELSSLLSSLEDDSNADARGLYLSGWSGKEGYRFDRIMRGTVTLAKFALSVFGGIQPGPLARHVRSAFSGERADGLLQRFQLLVWPDPEPFEYVDRWPDSRAKQAAKELFERADTFDPDAIGQRDTFGNEPPFVRLSDEAQTIFKDWYTRFMQLARRADSGNEESAPLAAHFGKYPGLVGKLALIFHVADGQGEREVSAVSLYKALGWIDYLTPHARRVYHAVEHPESGAAELLLVRLKRNELPPHFKAWEISRKEWHGLSDRDAVKKACRLLFEYGWLIELDPGGPSGGRPADPIYAVSPKVDVPA